jgi:starvation-inducible DNA-binding protein
MTAQSIHMRSCEPAVSYVRAKYALDIQTRRARWQDARCTCRASWIPRRSRVLVSTSDQVSDPRDTVASTNDDANLRHTITVLEELLAQSIYLRDLYRYARWQTTNVQYRRLHQLFDRHYQEQLHLVDVLLDRIRTLGGGSQIFARNFLQGTRFASALRGNKAVGHLLNELLGAHESVLNTARPNGSATNARWTHDFAVGQVVLANDAQSSSIRDQWVDWKPRQRFLIDGCQASTEKSDGP